MPITGTSGVVGRGSDSETPAARLKEVIRILSKGSVFAKSNDRNCCPLARVHVRISNPCYETPEFARVPFPFRDGARFFERPREDEDPSRSGATYASCAVFPLRPLSGRDFGECRA